MKNRIGYMQGRLVDQIDGKIQAFPLHTWRDEFPVANRIGIKLIEWTLDDFLLEQNPFCTVSGQAEIIKLSDAFSLRIVSVTGDCFMQAPFWKATGEEQVLLLAKLDLVIASSANLGVKYIVLPLVDNGGLESPRHRDELHQHLMLRREKLIHSGVFIAFESDYPPLQLREFISDFPSDAFGINYDIGNSASLGFDPQKEIETYGPRILNVHVKDRELGGTTVPLGSGAANIEDVLISLRQFKYSGNFILQTARAADRSHEQTLASYFEWTAKQLDLYYGS